jgi:hypothetical protein
MTPVKNILRVASLLFMVIGGYVHADDAQDDGVANPSIRPEAQTKTIDIFADALYWYTSETVDWAFVLKHGPNSETSTYKTFTFDWAPGFRVGLGYNMMHDQWDTQLSYTWFQSKAKDHAEGIVTTAFLAARLSLLEPFSTGKASLNLRYNIFDWDLGRSFLVSKHLSFRPAIGLKGGRITQMIRSDWTIPNFLNLFEFTASENFKQRFQGAGPKGGLTGKWGFGNVPKNYFSLIGQFEAGYLWGHWSMRDEFIDNLSTVINVKTTARNFGALVLHAFLGFGWDVNFDHDRSHFGLKLGYEIQDWFNQFQLYSDTSGSQNNDLILQGFNLGVRFDF